MGAPPQGGPPGGGFADLIRAKMQGGGAPGAPTMPGLPGAGGQQLTPELLMAFLQFIMSRGGGHGMPGGAPPPGVPAQAPIPNRPPGAL